MIHGTLSGFHRTSFVLWVSAATTLPTAPPVPANTRSLWRAQTHIHEHQSEFIKSGNVPLKVFVTLNQLFFGLSSCNF